MTDLTPLGVLGELLPPKSLVIDVPTRVFLTRGQFDLVISDRGA
jgi:hypothetical protein